MLSSVLYNIFLFFYLAPETGKMEEDADYGACGESGPVYEYIIFLIRFSF